jgi:hypothetical protein
MSLEEQLLDDLMKKLRSDTVRAVRHFHEMAEVADIDDTDQSASIIAVMAHATVVYAQAWNMPKRIFFEKLGYVWDHLQRDEALPRRQR